MAKKFSKEAQKMLSKSQLEQLSAVLMSLTPQSGDRLTQHNLREIKLQGKRVYYFVIESSALLVDISDKDVQKDAIRKLRAETAKHLEILRNLIESE